MHPRLVIGLVALLLIGGCARSLESVEETYRPDARRAQSRASTIVFVPGIMGVELHQSTDGRSVWGSFSRAQREGEALYEIALPLATADRPVRELRDTIVPGGELLFAELDFQKTSFEARAYPGALEGLFQALVDEGGHHHHRVKPIGKDDVREDRSPIIGFGYDWRRSIASEAERLHETVVAASKERFARTGKRRIDIIAHSLGTQLVRWYLRYGTAPAPTDGSLPELTWAGAEYVERALLIGPPNSGSARALLEVLEGSHVNAFIPTYPPAIVATFPTAYELMPRPGDGVVYWSDSKEPLDLYDVTLWEGLGWGPFAEDQDESLRPLIPDATSAAERRDALRTHVAACLENARAVHRALDRPARRPLNLRVHSFVGDFHPTKIAVRVDRTTGEVEWDGEESGDGTVPRSSALGLSWANHESPPRVVPDSVHFTEAKHLPMVGDPALLNQALYLLLEAPDPPE